MKKELHLINDLNQLHCLHDFLDRISVEFSLSPHTSMNLKLALEEALVNIILYAYPNQENKDIYVFLDASPGELKFELVDFGMPFNPLTKPEPDISLSEEKRPVGGLGIFLVKKMMTHVAYARFDGKNVLTLVKEIS